MAKSEKKSNRSENKKNILIWAVDPNQNPEDSQNIVKELNSWAKALKCDVQPVSIFSKSLFAWPVERLFPFRTGVEKLARQSLHAYLKKMKIKNFLPPQTVFIDSLSNRKMAMAMTDYAEQKKALAIFANTRAKKTWAPIRIGGFAETLIGTSRTPVLLMNPQAKPSVDFSSILFPTDFTNESKTALLKLEPFAKAFNSQITLFNQVEDPTLYLSEFNGIWQTPGTNFKTLMADIEKSRKDKATQWGQMLETMDIKSNQIIVPQKKYIAAEAISLAKKRKINLIAMGSRAGVVEQSFLGSVAQDLLLEAKCPVLIIHKSKMARQQKTKNRDLKGYKPAKDLPIESVLVN